jgi:hypothetical protein
VDPKTKRWFSSKLFTPLSLNFKHFMETISLKRNLQTWDVFREITIRQGGGGENAECRFYRNRLYRSNGFNFCSVFRFQGHAQGQSCAASCVWWLCISFDVFSLQVRYEILYAIIWHFQRGLCHFRYRSDDNFCGEIFWKLSIERFRNRWKDNIGVKLLELGFEDEVEVYTLNCSAHAHGLLSLVTFKHRVGPGALS